MNDQVWNEGGQRFIYQGSCIRTLKPSTLKMAYGDERLREIREGRAGANPARPGRVRRILSGIVSAALSAP